MKITTNPRIIIAGSVNSSKRTLEKLIEHDMNIVHVLGLSKEKSKNVSGYQDLKELAENNNLEFSYFENINDDDTFNLIASKKPDLLFVVGLSQLVKEKLLNLPTYGCVGYHPTLLPIGRGRAAIAWIILENIPAAATFFLMDEGMDSGDILVQEPIGLNGDEYAGEVISKIMLGIDNALNKLLPRIKIGELPRKKQNENEATFLGKRAPSDGMINWNESVYEIHKLIRAVSKPLPGAFTYHKTKKLIIWRAEIERSHNYIGVPGRIQMIENDNLVVQTGDGLLRITEFEGVEISQFRVGQKLGFNEFDLLKMIQETKEN